MAMQLLVQVSNTIQYACCSAMMHGLTDEGIVLLFVYVAK